LLRGASIRAGLEQGPHQKSKKEREANKPLAQEGRVYPPAGGKPPTRREKGSSKKTKSKVTRRRKRKKGASNKKWVDQRAGKGNFNSRMEKKRTIAKFARFFQKKTNAKRGTGINTQKKRETTLGKQKKNRIKNQKEKKKQPKGKETNL